MDRLVRFEGPDPCLVSLGLLPERRYFHLEGLDGGAVGPAVVAQAVDQSASELRMACAVASCSVVIDVNESEGCGKQRVIGSKAWPDSSAVDRSNPMRPRPFLAPAPPPHRHPRRSSLPAISCSHQCNRVIIMQG